MTKRRPQRWLSLLILVALVGALAACSGAAPAPATTPDEASPSEPTLSPEAATPADADPAPSADADADATATPVAAGPQVGMTPGAGQGMGQGGPHGAGQGHGPQHGQGGPGMGGGHGQGMGGPPPGRGPDNPWRTFHQQPVPAEYANLTNPVPADEESIARGEALYQAQCAVCHGPTGLGDGDAGVNLDPPPAPVARTAQMMSDGYLYWRIHDGGFALGSAMPAYGTILSENDIWDIINFLRSLGATAGAPTMQQQIALQDAVEQGVITQDEADLFQRVHDLVEAYKQDHWDELRTQAGGDPDAMLDLMLQGLIDQGQITPDEAEAFRDIHQRLHDAGLMP